MSENEKPKDTIKFTNEQNGETLEIPVRNVDDVFMAVAMLRACGVEVNVE